MCKDKVPAVRIEFASSLLHLKPYMELTDPPIVNDMMSTLTQMLSDIDRDVVEAVEQCDYELLLIKKKTKEEIKALVAQDAQRAQMESSLVHREVKVGNIDI